MGESSKYFVLKQKAVPEVLLKVVEAKKTFRERHLTYSSGCNRKSGVKQEFFL